MNPKKMLMAWIGGLVAMMALAVPFHTMLMKDIFMPPTPVPPQMHFVMLAYALVAFIMSYMYPIGYKGGSPVVEGIRFGVVMGVMFSLPREMVIYGTLHPAGLGLRYMAIETVWHAIEQGVGGAVIGLIYGRSQA